MDEYLKQYREMISLRGLTDHTIISYSTYIRAYLNYLSEILHKLPEDVSWAELRDFIRWLQKEKQLSDRTVNHCISQLRFFTMYVLHRPWNQEMEYHVHMHCIISGGGLTTDQKIRKSKSSFFIPVKVLRDKFKGKYLAELDSLYKKQKMVFSSSCEKLCNSYE